MRILTLGLTFVLAGCVTFPSERFYGKRVAVLEIAGDRWGARESVEILLGRQGFVIVEKSMSLDVDYYVTGTVWLAQLPAIQLPEIDHSEYDGYESPEVAIVEGLLYGLAAASGGSYIYGSIRFTDARTGRVVLIYDNVHLKRF